MVKIKGLITITELKSILKNKKVRVQKLIEKRERIYRRPKMEDANTFLLSNETLAEKEGKYIQVWKDNGGWTLIISDLLGKDLSEYRVDKCRKSV